MRKGGTCGSGELGPGPGPGPGRGAALLGLSAEGPPWSRSERSSLEVALEKVSRPLSVVVGLETEEPALSEGGRLGVEEPCSMKGTPPTWGVRVGEGGGSTAIGHQEGEAPEVWGVQWLPDRLLLLRVLVWAASI